MGPSHQRVKTKLKIYLPLSYGIL